MNVKLRDPNIIMKLSRLGSFHQSKLSFLRSFLKEFKDWDYKRDLFDLDKKGFGVAVFVCAIGIIFFTLKESYNQNDKDQLVQIETEKPKKIEKKSEVKKTPEANKKDEIYDYKK